MDQHLPSPDETPEAYEAPRADDVTTDDAPSVTAAGKTFRPVN